MMHTYETNNTYFILNPQNHYEHDFDEYVFKQACGLLINWLETDTDSSLLARIENNYDYGIAFEERPEVTIDEDLGYNYPEDPILYPYLHAIKNKQEMLIYPYAFVVYRESPEHEWVYQRCD